MTIMNSKIREELTELLADHLVQTSRARYLKAGDERAHALAHRESFLELAEDAMDFIYGEPDGDVQKSEQQEVQASHGFAWFSDQGGSCGDPCSCGESGCSWPGNVDRLEGGPVEVTAVYGVMNPPGALRESFVYLGPLSRTEGYVPVPRSDSEPKVQ